MLNKYFSVSELLIRTSSSPPCAFSCLGRLPPLCIDCTILCLGERVGVVVEGCLDWTTDWKGKVGPTLVPMAAFPPPPVGKNLPLLPPVAPFFILSISCLINSFFILILFQSDERIGSVEGCLDWTPNWTGMLRPTPVPPVSPFFILSISCWINSFFILSSFRILLDV